MTDRGRETGDYFTEDIVDQVWAETVVRYNAGEQWYLDDHVEDIARKVQSEHTEMNGKQGLIEQFLSQPLPEDWDSWALENRLAFFGDSFGETPKKLVPRQKVCAMELWVELFHGDPKSFTQAQAREFNGILRRLPNWKSRSSVDFGPLYGRQRAFVLANEYADFTE